MRIHSFPETIFAGLQPEKNDPDQLGSQFAVSGADMGIDDADDNRAD